MKKQGYNDRLDESLGMRRGPERDFKQSFKDRRDESRGMKGVMSHDKAPKQIKADEAGSVKAVSAGYKNDRGYCYEAFEYKY